MKTILFSLTIVAATAAELPVKQVVLYKHGVGYFERAGDLRAGESARLDFKSSEMNDVLKSLTISEAGGGKVAGVRYDSSDPLSKRLAEYPFKVGERSSLAAFLDQLKGARIEAKVGGESITGAIVSGRTVEAYDKNPARELVVLLADSGALQTIDLSAASSVKLQDPALQQALKDYLMALANSRSMDQRSVYIDSTD